MTDQLAEQARNEAFRNIGRNVVNLQKMEGLLKALVKSGGVQGFASEFKARLDKRHASVEKQSMGILVSELFSSVFVDEPAAEGPETVHEPWLSTRFSVELDPHDAEQLKTELSRIVEERNILIHQLLPRMDFHSIQSCRDLCSQLEEQNERAKRVFHRLLPFIQAAQELQEKVREYVASAEFEASLRGKDPETDSPK